MELKHHVIVPNQKNTVSESSKQLDIAANRTAEKYSQKELLLRVAWGVGKFIFRFSPRPFFGFRRWLLRCFGAKVEGNVNIYPTADIYFPWNLKIGEFSSIGERARVYNLGMCEIGKRTTISQGSHLCGGTHDYNHPEMTLVKSPIIIGDDAWICADAFVGPGIKVGNLAIVAARSVVVSDVEPNCIVGGNPAKIIKKRQ